MELFKHDNGPNIDVIISDIFTPRMYEWELQENRPLIHVIANLELMLIQHRGRTI
jgi:hypothetical protein